MPAGPAQSQALAVASRLPAPPARDGNSPLVIVPSALELTQEQESQLLQHCLARLTTLEQEHGRTDYGAPNWLTSQSTTNLQSQAISFMGRQHLAHLVMQGQMDWRTAIIGGIYSDTNIHFPITRRILLQQIARAINYYTGTDPWFTAYDVGLSDAELADKVERWLRYEADQSGLTQVVNTAITLAFIQGQQVIKTTHEKRVDYYETWAEVLVDAKGQPFTAQDGDYIFKADVFVPAVDADGNPSPTDHVLKRDGKTPWPGIDTFKKVKLRRSLMQYSGARSACIHYLDFLAPLTAEDIQTADCVVHLFNQPIIEMMQRFIELDWQATGKPLSPQQQVERLSELVHALMPGSSGTNNDQLAGANQARPELKEGEGSTGLDTIEPLGSFAEFYLHYDANGDGLQESILVICDRDCRIPIYYDYVANVTWNGKRPFDVIRVNPVSNRWHGQSQIETFWNIQETIDLFINRMHLAQMSSGRVDLWNPQLTIEGEQNPNLELNWGSTYTLKDPTVDPKQVLHSIHLQDLKYSELKDFVQLLIQIAINMSGVSNVNDGQMAALDTQKLATGIKNLEQSGEELFGVFIADLRPGVQCLVRNFGHVAILHMDQPKAFKYFEGDVGVLAMITPEEVRNLRLDVDISLTKYRSQQEAAQGMSAWAIGTQYYTLPPQAQAMLAPLARRLLKAYQQRDADEIIQPMLPDPTTMAQPGAQPGDAAAVSTAEPPPEPVTAL